MKKLIVHHKAMLTKDSSLDFDRIMRTRYLYEFDREVQCVSVPTRLSFPAH